MNPMLDLLSFLSKVPQEKLFGLIIICGLIATFYISISLVIYSISTSKSQVILKKHIIFKILKLLVLPGVLFLNIILFIINVFIEKRLDYLTIK
jgi:hypothetical protein